MVRMEFPLFSQTKACRSIQEQAAKHGWRVTVHSTLPDKPQKATSGILQARKPETSSFSNFILKIGTGKIRSSWMPRDSAVANTSSVEVTVMDGAAVVICIPIGESKTFAEHAHFAYSSHARFRERGRVPKNPRRGYRTGCIPK